MRRGRHRYVRLVGWIRAHPFVVGIVAIAVAAVGVLAFAVFGVHTLFIDDTVNEAQPVFAASGSADSIVVTQPSTTAPANSVTPVTTVVTANPRPPAITAPASASPLTSPATSPTTTAPVPVVTTVAAGTFVERSHPGQGTAVVLNDGSTQRFLRFENFSTDNGPDLNVYLTRADANAPAEEYGAAGAFVDLGDLKGNIGDQNYEIPADVDLTEFDTVVVWCVRFAVAFTTADLVPSA